MNDRNEADTSCCASCGITGGDDIKLKKCTACYLVRYCSIKCQKAHRPKHKRACKKRAAKLRDELLFKQPESNHRGDCPICMIPLPLDPGKTTIMACCSKLICDGCDYANDIREAEASLDPECPFCRETRPSDDKGLDNQRMKRIKANDPVAMRREGTENYLKGDYISAFEYFTKAAGLGDVNAHYKLAVLYDEGKGVEKDSRKEIHHLEEAAIGGHPYARFNLGCEEEGSGNIERAVKHYTIAANQGHDGSVKSLMVKFKEGFVSKDDLAAALRANQAAVDATKSPQREAAGEYYRISRNGG
eukprot:scaffold10568_cov140-Skeletonema_dohrnii-CCMP3373.AAC.4